MYRDVLRRFAGKKSAAIPAALLLVIMLMAVIGPMISGKSYKAQNTGYALLPPKIPALAALQLGVFDGTAVVRCQKSHLGELYPNCVVRINREEDVVFQGETITFVYARVDMYKLRGAEGVYYWFGADDLGRDQFTRLWRGARISLALAFSAAIVNLGAGVLAGAVCGYYGGKADMLIQRLAEIIDSIPEIPLLILCVVMFGANLLSFIAAFCLTGWISTASLTRALFYKNREADYVTAARAAGLRDFRVMARHILPNAAGPIITAAAISIPRVIFGEAALSYLGLGFAAPESSIGTMLNLGQGLLLTFPHVIFFPAALIILLMFCFNMVGNGLREAFQQ